MTSIIFMGTPAFSAPILESLTVDYEVLGVVTQPDRKVGRKQVLTASPVKEVALKHNIPVFQPNKLSGSSEIDQLIALAPDFIVTAAFGQFLPTKLLKSVKIGAINVHGSLLPKYRGGAPIQYSLLNEDSETGITIIYMVKAMDAGNMIAQQSIPILPQDDAGALFEKLSIVGRDLLLATLPKLIAGDAGSAPQDESKVTFSPTIQPEEEQLDFTLPAHQVNAKIRALSPHPGAYCIVDGQRTKIWQAEVLAETTNLTPGKVVTIGKKQLVLACGEGSQLSIKQIQPAGKNKMPIAAYLNGGGKGLEEGKLFIDAK